MPPRPDAALITLYERAQYRVRLARGGHAVIHVHRPLPAALHALVSGPDTVWAFITAWNPHSQPQPVRINRRHQRRLLERLRQLSPVPRIRPGVGVGPVDVGGRRWREASLFVSGIDPAAVDTLMREFRQHAVVCGRGHGFAELRFAPET